MNEEQGLAGALEQAPDFSAPLPQTPEELEQRKGTWRDVLSKIESDPNLMRAIGVMGVRLMQPGATFGQGVASGFGAYEAGKEAQIQQERQGKLDAQQAMQQDLQMEQARQRMAQSAALHPLELQAKQAAVDAIPDEAKRRRAQLEFDAWKLQKEMERFPLDKQLLEAQIDHQRAGAAAQRASSNRADKQSSAELRLNNDDRDLAAYMTVVKEENKDWNDSRVLVEARRRMAADRYGVSANIRTNSSEEKALALYEAYPELTPVQQTLMSPDEKAAWALGRKMYMAKNGGKTASASGPALPGGVRAVDVIPFERNASGKVTREGK